MAKINKRHLLIPAGLLLIYLVIRLIDQAQILTQFPIGPTANDYSAHLGRLHFLIEYGYREVMHNWYNATNYVLKYYSPLWYFLAAGVNTVFKNVQATTYAMLIFCYAGIAGIIYKYKEKLHFTKEEAIAYTLFFLANPLAIGYFVRLGKLPELLAWLLFIGVFILTRAYKEKKLDLKFYIPFTALLIAIFYTHILFFVVCTIFLLGFFLARKEKAQIIRCGAIVAVSGIYFLKPIVTDILGKTTMDFPALARLFSSSYVNDQIMAFLVPLAFLAVMTIYLKSNKLQLKKQPFEMVQILFATLLLTRILAFIPIFNKPESDSYNTYFILLTLFYFFNIKWVNVKYRIAEYTPHILTGLAIAFIAVSATMTPWYYQHDQDTQDYLAIAEEIEEHMIVIEVPKKFYPNAFYAYTAIEYNSTTPGGWSPENITQEYQEDFEAITNTFKEENPKEFHAALDKMKVKEVITYKDNCATLEEFKLNKKTQEGNFCLFSV